MEIIFGIITGIASAAIFHIILRRLKPKIIISEKIARETVEINGKTLTEYRIKVVNCRRRAIINIRTFVDIVRLEKNVDGPVYFHGQLPSFDDDLPYMDPYRKNDKDGRYAVWPRLSTELEEKWKNPNTEKIIIHIYCVDAFSGADAMFSQTYSGANAIVDGQFRSGKSLDIIKDGDR